MVSERYFCPKFDEIRPMGAQASTKKIIYVPNQGWFDYRRLKQFFSYKFVS